MDILFQHWKGYECIKILIAMCLNRLKGLMIYNEGVALKRKIVFPLLITIKVWREKEEQEKRRKRRRDISTYVRVHAERAQSFTKNNQVEKWQ